MREREFNLHNGQMGAAITVRVTSQASRNEINGILDNGTINIRLVTPAAEEKANQALIQFISKVLQVEPAWVEIVGGMEGKDKLVTITNINKETVQERILQWFNQDKG